MTALQTINVSKTFTNHKALTDVSISVNEQSIFGLLGPNGAGKTTLIRIVNMITSMDEGQVLLNGKPITQNDIIKIGYLPEERGLYKKMKVGEQAIYLAQLKGMSKNDAYKSLKIWFEKFEISSWWNKKVEELSKGMQQKIQFIVTVLHKPSLLIFDEPFSGFDPINANMLKDEIINLRNEGSTIIFSTHNMSSVEELCDHIALINKSKLILSGEIHEIKNRYKENVYEISYLPKLNGKLELDRLDFSLLNSEKSNGGYTSKIRIAPGKTPNELLNKIIPQADIFSFHEILPSVNDIFIKEVKHYNK
jgi:ABC-2 type transport system ATP-binding protein